VSLWLSWSKRVRRKKGIGKRPYLLNGRRRVENEADDSCPVIEVCHPDRYQGVGVCEGEAALGIQLLVKS
jgi:hypothetical protein